MKRLTTPAGVYRMKWVNEEQTWVTISKSMLTDTCVHVAADLKSHKDSSIWRHSSLLFHRQNATTSMELESCGAGLCENTSAK